MQSERAASQFASAISQWAAALQAGQFEEAMMTLEVAEGLLAALLADPEVEQILADVPAGANGRRWAKQFVEFMRAVTVSAREDGGAS